MMFRDLSNVIYIDEDKVKMLQLFKTPTEFIATDKKELDKYVLPKKAESIKKTAEISQDPVYNKKELSIELSSLIRIFMTLMEEKRNIQ